MSITLSDGTTTVAMNNDLFWSDEHNWNPVSQTAERTVTGALLISSALLVAGRPITLEPEDDSTAWTDLATVAALRNWAAVPGKVLTLTLRAHAYTVVFRHQDGGLTARPVVHYNDSVDTDRYLCTVRFTEI